MSRIACVGVPREPPGGSGVDDLLQDLQAAPHRPGGPDPFGDHELVAGSEAVEIFPELRPAGEAPKANTTSRTEQ